MDVFLLEHLKWWRLCQDLLTSNGRGRIVASCDRRGHHGHRQVGNDGHHEEEKVLHDENLERGFFCLRNFGLILVAGRLCKSGMMMLKTEEVVVVGGWRLEVGRLEDGRR